MVRKILEKVNSRRDAFNLEGLYIKKINTLSLNGYNISPTGGMNEWGGEHSEESKKKNSKSSKGIIPWNKGKSGIYSKEL